jgi:hypothetical protein
MKKRGGGVHLKGLNDGQIAYEPTTVGLCVQGILVINKIPNL